MISSQKCISLIPVAVLVSLVQLSCLEAKVVNYTLEVYYFSGSPDGVYKDKILGFNGQFPGPTLEAEVGDVLEIRLVNLIQDGQNTTVHWHGFNQKNFLFEDGTGMISQCPLPAGRSQIFRFNATQTGTFWYHSHVNSQYTEGMFGALIIHGKPEAYTYDADITLTVSDWYHRTAFQNEEWHLSPPSRGVPPYIESGLINGMGRYPCTYAQLQNRTCDAKKQQRPLIRVEREKTYRLRVINAAAVAMFNISIDDHSLSTIEVDGIDVHAVSAETVSIAAGQRYSFLIQCNTSSSNNEKFLIRAAVRNESFMLIEGANINQYPEALMIDVTAVLECTNDDLGHTAHKQVEIASEPFTYTDIVPPLPDAGVRELLDELKLRPLDGSSAPDRVDEEFLLNVYFHEDFENIRRGSFNITPFSLPDDKPLLMKLIDHEPLPQNSFPVEIESGSVVQIVINNPFLGPHPFHLHGHHFWVLGTGAWNDGNYTAGYHNLTLDGVKRDTFVVNEASWGVIRFVADNPGLWLFHCHIDWHSLSGMAMTFVEGADIVRQNVRIPEEALRVCRMHSDANANNSTYSRQSPAHLHSSHY